MQIAETVEAVQQTRGRDSRLQWRLAENPGDHEQAIELRLRGAIAGNAAWCPGVRRHRLALSPSRPEVASSHTSIRSTLLMLASMKESLITERPWFTAPTKLPNEPVGMLDIHEASLFYELAKQAFSGRGTIVDAGSFLGRSAFYFAHGLKANPHFSAARDRIHCFDNFVVNEENTVYFFRTQLGLDLKVGDSTRSVFDQQVASVRDTLTIHAGDFHAEKWNGGPIEILMVDVAKSESLWCHLVEQMFPHLIPGVSLVIHQDYHHPWLPHIHVVMEYLAEYFEVLVPRVDCSIVFRCRKAVPESMLRRVVAYEFTHQEQLALIDGALQRLSEVDRHYVEQTRAVLLCRMKDWVAARRQLDDLDRRAPQYAGDRGWADGQAGVRSTLDEHEGWWHHSMQNWRRSLELADRLLAQRGLTAPLTVMKGAALLGLQKLTDAESVLRAGMTAPRIPGYSYVYIVLAQCLKAQGRHAEATEMLLEGLTTRQKTGGPTVRDFADNLLEVWASKPDAPAVKKTLAGLRPSLANEPEFLVMEARCHAYLGDQRAAEQSLATAVQLGLSQQRLHEVRKVLQWPLA